MTQTTAPQSFATMTRTGTLAPIASPITGKVSKAAEKAATVLTDIDKATLLGVALKGKGAVKTAAMAELARGQAVKTLPAMLAQETIDRTQWGDYLALLVAEFGVTTYSRPTMKGREGVRNYIDATVHHLIADEAAAEGAKRAEALQKRLGEALNAQTRIHDQYARALAEIEAQKAIEAPKA